jgi:hypothetical protein
MVRSQTATAMTPVLPAAGISLTAVNTSLDFAHSGAERIVGCNRWLSDIPVEPDITGGVP